MPWNRSHHPGGKNGEGLSGEANLLEEVKVENYLIENILFSGLFAIEGNFFLFVFHSFFKIMLGQDFCKEGNTGREKEETGGKSASWGAPDHTRKVDFHSELYSRVLVMVMLMGGLKVTFSQRGHSLPED